MKDTVVAGSLRATDTLFSTTAQFQILRVPTSSNGTTFGPGSANNLLKSNGTSVYWTTLVASDIPTLSITDKTTGTLPVTRGGTGVTAIADIQAGKDGDGNTISSTYLKLSGGTLTGDTYFHSNTGSRKFYITRTGGTGESAGMWVDDSYFYIDVLNDETTANVQFKLQATDTEGGGGAGAQTSYIRFYGVNSKSTVAADYFTGNLTGNVTGNVTGSSGSCTGNAATATKATQDADGNTISSTYLKLSGGTMTGNLVAKKITIEHTSGEQQEYRVTYGSTVDMSLMIGTADENHGIYDSKASKWMIYADASGNVTVNGNAETATKATQDGSGNTITSTYAKLKADNDLINHSNEFTFAASKQSGYVWFNYRTAGGTNGNITEYKFGDGKGGNLASITSGNFSGNAATATKLASAGTTNQFYRGDRTWSDTLLGTLKITSNNNTLTIGSQNTSWTHIYSSANIAFIFNNRVCTTAGGLGNETYPWSELYLKDGIYYPGTKATYRMIRFINNTSDGYGNGIAIGGGGQTIIGGGESASAAADQAGNAGAEVMYICNDGDVNIFSNMQNGWDSRKTFTFNTSGNIVLPAGCRVGESGGALYLGNSGNQSWIYTQNICSQDSQKWKIHTNGNAEFNGNVQINASNTSGGGIILSDDGDIVDLNNGYCSMRFSYGVDIYSGKSGGSTALRLSSNGSITSYRGTGDTGANENGCVLKVGTNNWSNTGIFNGNGDGGGSGTANLIIKSWNGVGFVDGCTGNGMRASVNCRNGEINCYRVTANLGGSERRVEVDQSTSGTLYLFSNGGAKGIYSSTGYATGYIIKINSGGITHYGTVSSSSSKEVKTNIQYLNNTDYIDKLKPVSFIYKKDEKKKTHFGLIYEDTIDILPNICTIPEEDESKGINYIELVPVLLKEIQNLRKRIKSLEDNK